MGFLRYIVAICFLFNGCSITYQSTVEIPKDQPKSAPKKRGPIQLVCDEKCTSTEKKKLVEVENKVNETLMGKCFQDYVLSPDRKYNMLDLDPADMLAKMKEPTVLLVNYYSDIDVFTLGYEMMGEPVIHLNRVAMALYRFDICGEASVAIHEAAHAKGFMHRGNNPDEYNQSTVPYVMNRAFDQGLGNGSCCI